MRIHRLTTGVVRPKTRPRGIRRWLPGGWAESTLPVNAFAVEHPGGICLFDTGQEVAARRRRYFPWWHPAFNLSRFELDAEDEVACQLAERGITTKDIRWVVLSHLHTDHVGGLAPFASADVVVARLEWERSRGLGGRLRGYLPQRWPAGIVPRLVDLDGPAVGPFTGSHDLAGDGRLLLVASPGHTAGHVAMLVSAPDRRFLLAGDMAHSAETLPAAVMAFCRSERIVPLTAHGAAEFLN